LVSLLLQPSTPNNNEQATPTAQPMSAAEQAAYEVRIEDLQDQVSRLQQKRISVLDTRSESANKVTDVVTELVRGIEGIPTSECRDIVDLANKQPNAALAAHFEWLDPQAKTQKTYVCSHVYLFFRKVLTSRLLQTQVLQTNRVE
jgi:hypothetical protein